MPRKPFRLRDKIPDNADEATLRRIWPHPVLALKPTWCTIIGSGDGQKICENRARLPITGKTYDYDGCPVGIYMSQDSKKNATNLFKLPMVKQALQKSRFRNKTPEMVWNQTMAYQSRLVGVAFFSKTPIEGKEYPFKDFPTPTKHHFYCMNMIWFKKPIEGFKANQGWSYFKDASILKQFISQIPAKFSFFLMYVSM